jgi:hypothetical protein
MLRISGFLDKMSRETRCGLQGTRPEASAQARSRVWFLERAAQADRAEQGVQEDEGDRAQALENAAGMVCRFERKPGEAQQGHQSAEHGGNRMHRDPHGNRDTEQDDPGEEQVVGPTALR